MTWDEKLGDLKAWTCHMLVTKVHEFSWYIDTGIHHLNSLVGGSCLGPVAAGEPRTVNLGVKFKSLALAWISGCGHAVKALQGKVEVYWRSTGREPWETTRFLFDLLWIPL